MFHWVFPFGHVRTEVTFHILFINMIASCVSLQSAVGRRGKLAKIAFQIRFHVMFCFNVHFKMTLLHWEHMLWCIVFVHAVLGVVVVVAAAWGLSESHYNAIVGESLASNTFTFTKMICFEKVKVQNFRLFLGWQRFTFMKLQLEYFPLREGFQ